MKLEKKYLAEVLDPTLYSSAWKGPNTEDHALHIEALLNEKASIGYELMHIIDATNGMGLKYNIFIFRNLNIV